MLVRPLFRRALAICALLETALTAASAAAATPPPTHPPSAVRLAVFSPSAFGRLAPAGFAIGKVIRTADGGQVFGFDIDQAGDDGLLASSQTVSPQGQVKSSVEIFSQSTGAIVKVVARTDTMDDFVSLGILAGDVGAIEHEHPKSLLDVVRSFHLLDPVTGETFDARWTPPNNSNIIVEQVPENQATSHDVVFAIARSDDSPLLFGSDIAANTSGKIQRIDPNLFCLCDQPQFADDTATGLAVFGTSPDGGTVGGAVPVIGTIDPATGEEHGFAGVRIPPYNSGLVNGIAVDPSTGIACTTTELDAAVEFYKLSKHTGIAVRLPGSGGNQGNTGETVAVDPLHHLFLVVQPNGTVGPPGGSVVDVYDEKGDLRESITGFRAFSVTPGIVVNPATRTGFISGPTPDAITEFAY